MPCGIRGVWILDLGATGEWFVSFVMRNAELLVNRGARNWPHPALRAILPEGEARGSLALTQVWDTQWAFFSTFVEHSHPPIFCFLQEYGNSEGDKLFGRMGERWEICRCKNESGLLWIRWGSKCLMEK